LAPIILIETYFNVLKTSENLSKHFTSTSLRRDDVIRDVIKNDVYIQRRTLTKAFQTEKNMTLQVSC